MLCRNVFIWSASYGVSGFGMWSLNCLMSRSVSSTGSHLVSSVEIGSWVMSIFGSSSGMGGSSFRFPWYGYWVFIMWCIAKY